MMNSWFQQLTNPQRIMVHVIVFRKKNQNGFQCKYFKGQWQQNGNQFFYCFM